MPLRIAQEPFQTEVETRCLQQVDVRAVLGLDAENRLEVALARAEFAESCGWRLVADDLLSLQRDGNAALRAKVTNGKDLIDAGAGDAATKPKLVEASVARRRGADVL